jgi:hypothetical protein
MDEFV